MIKFIFIVFLLSFSYRLYTIEIDNLALINRLETSLILNQFSTNNKVSLINLKEDFSISIELYDINDTIVYLSEKYKLYTYTVVLNNKNNKKNYLEVLNEIGDINDEEILLLHKNGLIGVLKKRDKFDFITISGNSFISFNFLIDKLNLKNQTKNKMLELKYYNYLPNDIKVDSISNEFTFYSEILKRNFKGNFIYNKSLGIYIPKLENGILLYD